MSVCVFVCRREFPRRESDHQRIWLAQDKSMQVESEIVVIFRAYLETTQFPADQTHLHTNISETANQKSPPNLNCPFLTSDGMRKACLLLQAMLIKARYLLVYPGS